MNTKVIRILTILSIFSYFGTHHAMEEIEISGPNKKLRAGVIENNLEKVQEALKEGADIDLKCEKIITQINFSNGHKQYKWFKPAIFYAAKMGYSEIVKYLLRAGAKTKAEDSHLLFEINLDKSFELFKFLIVEMGMDIKVRVDKKYSCQSLIGQSIYSLNLNALKLVVYYGLNLNDKCFHKDNAISYINWWSTCVDFTDEEKTKAEEIKLFINKHAARMKNLKNKNLKNMVQKVNGLLKHGINSVAVFPQVLIDLVIDYHSLYPNDAEEFFKLSDHEIDEFIKMYCEEFEKEQNQFQNVQCSKCSIM